MTEKLLGLQRKNVISERTCALESSKLIVFVNPD